MQNDNELMKKIIKLLLEVYFGHKSPAEITKMLEEMRFTKDSDI